MKSEIIVCILVLLFYTIVNNAQILNGGFEDWNPNGNPVGWSTNNAPPTFTTILKTNDAHSGNWAVEGNVVAFNVFAIGPSLINGEEGQGAPINIRPAALEGYYKLISVQDDILEVLVYLIKNGEYAGIGAAIFQAANLYTKFRVDITPGLDIPDSALISIVIVNTSGFAHVGTKIFIDDLSWSSTTDIANPFNQIPYKFNLEQNYPNPFNPTTRIRYQVSSNTQVSLKVYDLLGNVVSTLVDEYKEAGSYEVPWQATNLPSGVYFYRLLTGNFIDTKKMTVIK